MSNELSLRWQRGSRVLERLCDETQNPGIFLNDWPLTEAKQNPKLDTSSKLFSLYIYCGGIMAVTVQLGQNSYKYWWLWSTAVQLWGGRGAHNSRQLFALIVRWDSALLNGADTLLINGKCCIYILASGTIQLLRWQGAQCWLHSVTNPTGCPFGLIVTNPIEKRLIDLLTDCLVEW